jgi:hypothetical protein
MAAVMIAGLVSLGVAGDYVYFGAMRQTLDVTTILIVTPVAGLAGSIIGGLFTRAMLAFVAPERDWLKRLKTRRSPSRVPAASWR